MSGGCCGGTGGRVFELPAEAGRGIGMGRGKVGTKQMGWRERVERKEWNGWADMLDCEAHGLSFGGDCLKACFVCRC
jgi:hypothetical protein